MGRSSWNEQWNWVNHEILRRNAAKWSFPGFIQYFLQDQRNLKVRVHFSSHSSNLVPSHYFIYRIIFVFVRFHFRFFIFRSKLISSMSVFSCCCAVRQEKFCGILPHSAFGSAVDHLTGPVPSLQNECSWRSDGEFPAAHEMGQSDSLLGRVQPRHSLPQERTHLRRDSPFEVRIETWILGNLSWQPPYDGTTFYKWMMLLGKSRAVLLSYCCCHFSFLRQEKLHRWTFNLLHF